MKKKLFVKIFVFAAIAAFMTVTSCTDLEDEINNLDTELATLKSSTVANSELSSLKSQLESSISSTSADLQAAKTALASLQASSASTEALNAAKGDIVELSTKLTSMQGFQSLVDSDLATLKADMAKAATEEEVNALKDLLGSDIDGLRQDLGAKIANLEAIIAVADGDVEEIEDILSQLEEQLEAIEENREEIEAVKADLEAKFTELSDEIALLKTNLGDLEENLGALDEKVDAMKVELDMKIADLTEELGTISALVMDLFGNLDRRVTALTFIPDFTSPDGTPQLPVHFLGEWYKPLANVENWDPDHRHDIDLTPYKGITYAKFQVSPSNTTLDDFEVVGLLHKTSEILFRSTDEPLLKAVPQDATLNNGVLTVPILVHADLYRNNEFSYGEPLLRNAGPDDDDESYSWRTDNWEQNISVALQVKNKNRDEEDNTQRLVVSTEYVRALLSKIHARIEMIDEQGDVGIWQNRLPSHMNDEIALATYYKQSTAVKLWNGYNQVTGVFNGAPELNLNDLIQAIAQYNGTWRVLENFGYDDIESKFIFELVDNNNEGVEQSNTYVVLNGSTGVVKVTPNPGNAALPHQAAVGRTPVVLAKVVNNDKVYAVGYIKIIISDNFNASPVQDIPAIVLDPFVLNCDASYVFTDGNKLRADMDQIFNHERVKLGKDLFFDEYTGEIIHTISNFIPAITGNIANPTDFAFEYATYQNTQSGLLENYIKGTVKNTTPAGKYTLKTTLSSQGYRPDIILTWEIEVKLPVYNLTDNTAILSGNKIVINPTILQQGGKTSAAYEALLNNGFMHSENNFTFTPLPGACDDALTPYFVFTQHTLPAGYAVANGGTTLRTTTGHPLGAGHLAARIETDPLDEKKFFLRLNTDNNDNPGASWYNYTPLHEAAKGLVGKTVSVQPRGYINNMTYNWINLRGHFNIEFTYPVSFALPQDASVYDQANQGLNVYTLNAYNPSAVLVDWHGEELTVATAEGRALINHYEVGLEPTTGAIWTEWVFAGFFPVSNSVLRPGYLGWWYAPVEASTVSYSSPFVFDVDNATSNISSTGAIVNDIVYPIPAGMQLKIQAVGAGGSMTVVSDGTSYEVPSTFAFTWLNGATGAVQNDFKIAVPVIVQHKWGTVTDRLVITVKVGSGN